MSDTDNAPSGSASLRILVAMRHRIRAFAESIDTERAFIVPTGFSNNIAWNLAHLVVTQQILCYKLSGLPMHVEDDLCRLYAKGSSPADWPAPPDVAHVWPLLTELAERTVDDYQRGLFERFESYTTSAGVVLTNIDEAIAFNNVHEGIHLGYAMALRRATLDE